mmetsp:Transcript_84546/g.168835  ORF Transcript_84546/g.168835 Transcript_84546/m.168835 type:complete len:93 (-) Transcript_84546:261-539(-)
MLVSQQSQRSLSFDANGTLPSKSYNSCDTSRTLVLRMPSTVYPDPRFLSHVAARAMRVNYFTRDLKRVFLHPADSMLFCSVLAARAEVLKEC